MRRDLLFAILLLALLPMALAADPGHSAASVSAGTFEAGDFVFPNDLSVTDDFYVASGSLFVNASSGLVGLGTTSPTQELVILKSANEDVSILIRNPSTGASASSSVNVGNGTSANSGSLAYTGVGYSGSGLLVPQQVSLLARSGVSGGILFSTLGDYPIVFSADGIAASDERLRIDSTGVGVLTTTPAYALDVNGTLFQRHSSMSSLGSILMGKQPSDLVLRDGFLYYLRQGEFSIVDARFPSSLQVLSTTSLFSTATGMDIQGDFAYIAADTNLYILNISDVTSPSLASTLTVGNAKVTTVTDVVVVGSRAYVLDNSTTTISAIDVSDPYNVFSISNYSTSESSDFRGALVVRGDVAYISSDSALYAIDISNPASMSQRGLYPGGNYESAVISENVLYAAASDRVWAYNVTDPASIDSYGSYTVTSPTQMVAGNDLLYVASRGGGIHAVDVSDPSSMTLVDLVSYSGDLVSALASEGTMLAAQENTGGNLFMIDLKGADLSSLEAGPTKLSSLDVSQDVRVAGRLTASTGIISGPAGIQSGGPLGVAGNVTIAGRVLPSINNTFSLGSPTRVWKDLYVGNESLYIGGLQLSNNGGALEWGGSPVGGGAWVISGTLINVSDDTYNVTAGTLFIDNTNGRVGINKTPTRTLDVAGTTNLTASDGTGITILGDGNVVITIG